MPADRTDSGLPQNELPEQTGRVRPLRREQIPLVVRLVPVVDKIRQLYISFGLRPYRVFLVHVMWTGTQRGDGNEVEISRREILPTPRLLDMNATSEILRAYGLTEEGGVAVDQITTKYTEDDLMGRTPDLNDPAVPRTGLRNVDFFWEVQESRPSNPPPTPRRYEPNSVPMLGRDRFQWRVTLSKQQFDRARDRTFHRTQA